MALYKSNVSGVFDLRTLFYLKAIPYEACAKDATRFRTKPSGVLCAVLP